MVSSLCSVGERSPCLSLQAYVPELDLSLDARLLYVSTSIVDILGYLPNEVIGKSCWEYFHPDEIPFARAIHGRGVQLDKASVLNYCQIKNKSGQWIGCECVFTIVHDVLVASTSVYRRGSKSQRMYPFQGLQHASVLGANDR